MGFPRGTEDGMDDATIWTEDEHNENKTSLSEWKDAAIALAAFSTSAGGTVRFGITQQGKRVGVSIGANTLENLANDIRRSTDPPVFPSITVQDGDGPPLVIVRAEESPIKPVWAFGKPYKRVGRTNQSLSRSETLRLVEATTGHTWDGLPCEGLRAEHLSRAAVEDYLHRAERSTATSTQIVLDNLRLQLPDGKLCNAAALLFAEESKLPTGSQMQCGLFSDPVGVHFLDEQTIEASVLTQLRQALAFVARNTRKAIKITGRPEREEIPEYPEEAVREAIVNAIIHRDYTSSGHVQVRIYHDRLEVWNPGSLPYDVTIESLYATHPSRPRNRKLAEAFHRAGLIERWGTGTLRIVAACEDRGLPRPEFRYKMGTFMVVLRLGQSPREALPVLPEGINDRQREAIAYVLEHQAISSSQYQALYGVGERQARIDLADLVARGVLAATGRGRATHYVLPD